MCKHVGGAQFKKKFPEVLPYIFYGQFFKLLIVVSIFLHRLRTIYSLYMD